LIIDNELSDLSGQQGGHMADEEQPQQTPHTSPFEDIRRFDDAGDEYWSARELGKILGYVTNYRNFQKAIRKAEEACANSEATVSDHFAHVRKMVTIGSGAQRKIDDVRLSRYACYLVVQNADPEKPIVALGQTYFAVQTRRQELADEDVLAGLSENQRRLLIRGQLTISNRELAETANHAGVITTNDFAIFQDHGYRGLYGGLCAKDIHANKGLKPSQKILDYMGSDELAANLFRSSLTKQKIEREQISDKDRANNAHHEMGKAVRQTIIDTGATLPENLPTPSKSIQQLQREERRHIENQDQLSLFEGNDENNENDA
jgi:DNA-damage-inducible protein D